MWTVPESLEAKRSLPVRSTDDGRFIVGDYHPEDMWYTRHRPDGLDVHAPAGSVVIQNNVNIHAATVRQSTVPRITVHVDWASTAGSFGSGWGNARAGNDEAVAVWQGKREAKATAVPPRLMEDQEWGWLFDSTLPRPLASL